MNLNLDIPDRLPSKVKMRYSRHLDIPFDSLHRDISLADITARRCDFSDVRPESESGLRLGYRDTPGILEGYIGVKVRYIAT